MLKKVLKNVFKKDSQNKSEPAQKMNERHFLYAMEEDGVVKNYTYDFKTAETIQNENMIRQCYDEFVKRHGIDAIDNIVSVQII